MKLSDSNCSAVEGERLAFAWRWLRLGRCWRWLWALSDRCETHGLVYLHRTSLEWALPSIRSEILEYWRMSPRVYAAEQAGYSHST